MSPEVASVLKVVREDVARAEFEAWADRIQKNLEAEHPEGYKGAPVPEAAGLVLLGLYYKSRGWKIPALVRA